ncbi:MAG TPA: alpha/beta fold hydrolase [Solirubrobacterales bacterium]|jgi:pimeloyl-ACP methyl ester carboxylesterase|nr:alpha/beta fold hydrolase [Solirubrobacterales bacterium]
MSLDDWWDAGARRRLPIGGSDREVFALRTGDGPVLTLLHGFPSSSHDWAKVAPALAASHTILAPDFLGFGASAKPTDHTYAIAEQADLVEALWAAEEIERTALVAHDYAVSVTQELLARRREGALRVDLTSVTFLNGGLYPHLHRPEPGQLALLDPEQGPALVELIDEKLFTMSMAPTFAEAFDAAADSADIWRATSRDDGQRLLHRLIGYIPDRVANADRWTGALEATDVPRAFAWGMLDPVSGAHMAERIRERLPDAPFLALDDVAHWPQLEAPEPVAEAILTHAG